METTNNTEKNDGIASPKRRLTAFLLCFFLGIFAIHRFYVGRHTSGILQILFGTFTLYIWNLVDLILILSGKFKDKDGLYIKNWD